MPIAQRGNARRSLKREGGNHSTPSKTGAFLNMIAFVRHCPSWNAGLIGSSRHLSVLKSFSSWLTEALLTGMLCFSRGLSAFFQPYQRAMNNTHTWRELLKRRIANMKER